MESEMRLKKELSIDYERLYAYIIAKIRSTGTVIIKVLTGVASVEGINV